MPDPEVPPELQAVSAQTEQNRALKEAVKQNAQGRRSKAQAEQATALPPMIPMPDDPVAIAQSVDAEAEYAAQIAQAPAIDAARRSKLDETYLVYIKCDKGHAPHHPPHGIYLTGHPVNLEVPYTGWYSRYKKPGAQYWPNDVVCQACALEERSSPLDRAVEKTSPEGNLKINPRWLYRRAKDPKRALIEGEHRVQALGHASESGRRDALARAKAAGYEVFDQ